MKAKKLDRIVDDFINDPNKQPSEFESELDGLTNEVDTETFGLEEIRESKKVKDLIKSIETSTKKLKVI